MDIQKNMLNKKYLMVTGLIGFLAFALPNAVNHMFAWNSEEKEAPVVVKLVDEATIEVELVDESTTDAAVQSIDNSRGVEPLDTITVATDPEVATQGSIDIINEELISDESEIKDLESAEEIIEEEEIEIVEEDMYSEEVLIDDTLTWALLGTWSWDEWFEEVNNITIHIWSQDWETQIFGHGTRWKEITLISKFGFTCTTYIDANKAYRCGLWSTQEIVKEDIRVKYVEELIPWMDMLDPAMMDPDMVNQDFF